MARLEHREGLGEIRADLIAQASAYGLNAAQVMRGLEGGFLTEKNRAALRAMINDIQAAKAPAVAAEAAATEGSADFQDYLQNYGRFAYDPQSSPALTAANLQTNQANQEAGRNIGAALAQRGVSRSGQLVRAQQERAGAYGAALAQNTARDYQQQYGQYADQYQRDYNAALQTYGVQGDDYSRAMNNYYNSLAKNTESAALAYQQNINQNNQIWNRVGQGIGFATDIAGAVKPFI